MSHAPAHTHDDAPRLNLGCGLEAPAGWVNIEGSLNARLAKHPRLRRALAAARLIQKHQAQHPWPRDLVIHDLRKPLPFAEGSCAAVYCSHTLEHLYFDEARDVLRDCFRVLRPGGVARVIVPDLRPILEDYFRGFVGTQPDGTQRQRPRPDDPAADLTGAATPADAVLRRLQLRKPKPPRGPLPVRLYKTVNAFDEHKWMYDEQSMAHELAAAGFAEIARKGYLDSRIPGVETVERRDRIEPDGLCMEAVKPA